MFRSTPMLALSHSEKAYYASHVAVLASLIFLFGIAYSLIGQWFVTPSPAISSSSVQIINTPADIPNWHLFGNANIHTIPLSTHGLILMGVFLNEAAHTSEAIITHPGYSQKTYHVNDTLPGGSILRAILNDAVILEYHGQEERLVLQQNESIFTPPGKGLW